MKRPSFGGALGVLAWLALVAMLVTSDAFAVTHYPSILNPVTLNNFPQAKLTTAQTCPIGRQCNVVGTLVGPISAKLYATPADGDVNAIVDADGNASVNALTVNGNGHTIDGSATTTIGASGGAIVVQYSSVASGWVSVSFLRKIVAASPAVALNVDARPKALSAPVSLTAGVSGILPTANGGTGSSTFSAVTLGATWYSTVDRSLAAGNDVGDRGYPVGSVFRFLRAATITGVRYLCSNGGAQTFTVHAASSAEPGSGAQTLIQSQACAAQTPGVVNTCTFTTPIAVSDLTKVYTASVYGGSDAADCTMISLAPYICGTSAGQPCTIGPSIWLEVMGAKFGVFNSSTSLPNLADNARIASVEFVFTVP